MRLFTTLTQTHKNDVDNAKRNITFISVRTFPLSIMLFTPAGIILLQYLFVSLQIPRAIIEPLLFASLIFLMAGLRGGVIGWLWFSFVCILCANYANAYGKISTVSLKSPHYILNEKHIEIACAFIELN